MKETLYYRVLHLSPGPPAFIYYPVSPPRKRTLWPERCPCAFHSPAHHASTTAVVKETTGILASPAIQPVQVEPASPIAAQDALAAPLADAQTDVLGTTQVSRPQYAQRTLRPRRQAKK